MLTDARKNTKSNVAMNEVINPVCTVTIGFRDHVNFRKIMYCVRSSRRMMRFIMRLDFLNPLLCVCLRNHETGIL